MVAKRLHTIITNMTLHFLSRIQIMTKLINLDEPRYDQSTYWGRLQHFSQLTDPRNLLASEQEIYNSQRLLNEYKLGKVKIDDVEKLWKAKTLVDSSIHPDTGELIFLPFRMASFVPTNGSNLTDKFLLLQQCCFQIQLRP